MSLTKKHLPADLWRWLELRTSHGTTIYDCVRAALRHPKLLHVGLFAPDVEAYTVFREIFEPVIAEYHNVNIDTIRSVHDLGDADKLQELPASLAENVISTRVRCGRTVKGFPMASKLSSSVISFF